MKDIDLAIEQWEMIRERLRASATGFDVNPSTLKRRFCAERGIKWKSNCLFCERFADKNCMGCPLRRGGRLCYEHGEVYNDVCHIRNIKEMKILAVDDIIKCLKKMKVEEGSNDEDVHVGCRI